MSARIGASLWAVAAAVPIEQYGAAAVERTLRDMDRVAAVAVAHERVIGHLFAKRGVTVVPMALFTIFTTLARAVEETGSRRREVGAVARRIAGCEEWGVRMTRTTAAVVQGPGGVGRPASGTAFLAARRDAQEAARELGRSAARAADAGYRALAAAARDARRREDAPAGAVAPLLDAAFLVPRTGRAQFRAVARRVADAGTAAGSVLTLSGPWPAYNFVQPAARR